MAAKPAQRQADQKKALQAPRKSRVRRRSKATAAMLKALIEALEFRRLFAATPVAPLDEAPVEPAAIFASLRVPIRKTGAGDRPGDDVAHLTAHP